MKNLSEGHGNGNDLTRVHKALGGRLNSVGIQELLHNFHRQMSVECTIHKK